MDSSNVRRKWITAVSWCFVCISNCSPSRKNDANVQTLLMVMFQKCMVYTAQFSQIWIKCRINNYCSMVRC